MRLVPTSLALTAAAALAFLLAACGGSEPSTPSACFEGAATYEQALEAAPDEVLLAGETPISDCFAENQGAGDLAQVGETLIETATRLDAEAREEPGGKANVELGYLLGAASAGAEDTQGIHENLLRRLEVTARYAPGGQTLPPAFARAYRQGFDAGREGG
ncbi:MAG TPA: hypothetical protein VGG40_04475 [Solirubrobacterales bacterium]|jgi:hypothetical protein